MRSTLLLVPGLRLSSTGTDGSSRLKSPYFVRSDPSDRPFNRSDDPDPVEKHDKAVYKTVSYSIDVADAETGTGHSTVE